MDESKMKNVISFKEEGLMRKSHHIETQDFPTISEGLDVMVLAMVNGLGQVRALQEIKEAVERYEKKYVGD